MNLSEIPSTSSLLFLLSTFFLLACDGGNSYKPRKLPLQSPNFCPRAPLDPNLWEKIYGSSPSEWAADHGVHVLNEVPEEYVAQFNFELRKTPDPLLEQMVEAGAEADIFTGENVGSHPEIRQPWLYKSENGVASWLEIWIVPQKQYDEHNSFNLVLHEYGHLLHMILSDKELEWAPYFHVEWSPDVQALVKMCGKHCEDHGEAFAESFAAYFACDHSRQWALTHMPEVSKIFEKVERVGLAAFDSVEP